MTILRIPATFLRALMLIAALGWSADGFAQVFDGASGEPAAGEAPAESQRDLANQLIPELLEMGVDMALPAGRIAADGGAALAAVNRLRRQDGLTRFDHLSRDAADYVDRKVAAYRANRARALRMQDALAALGFDPGPIDGLPGPLTRQAVKKYQQAFGLPPTGEMTDDDIAFLETLRINKAVSSMLWPKPPAETETLDEPDNPTSLSGAEVERVRRQFQACWTPPPGIPDGPPLTVKVHVTFNDDGSVAAAKVPDLDKMSDPFERAVAESALRAVFNPGCLPVRIRDRPFEVWRDMDLSFTLNLLN